MAGFTRVYLGDAAVATSGNKCFRRIGKKLKISDLTGSTWKFDYTRDYTEDSEIYSAKIGIKASNGEMVEFAHLIPNTSDEQTQQKIDDGALVLTRMSFFTDGCCLQTLNGVLTLSRSESDLRSRYHSGAVIVSNMHYKSASDLTSPDDYQLYSDSVDIVIIVSSEAGTEYWYPEGTVYFSVEKDPVELTYINNGYDVTYNNSFTIISSDYSTDEGFIDFMQKNFTYISGGTVEVE